MRFLSCLIILQTLTACAAGGKADLALSAGADADGRVSHPDVEAYTPVPLVWEDDAADGRLWSAYTYRIIGGGARRNLLEATLATGALCPAYVRMSEAERVNFWAYLISLLARADGGCHPLALLPLPECAQDVDVFTNLECGVRTISDQVARGRASALARLSAEDEATLSALPFCAQP